MASRAGCREQRGCRVAASTSSSRGSLSGRRRCLCAPTAGRGRCRRGLALQITTTRGEEDLAAPENHSAENQQGCRESDVPSHGHWCSFSLYRCAAASQASAGSDPVRVRWSDVRIPDRPAIISIHFWLWTKGVRHRSREQYTHLIRSDSRHNFRCCDPKSRTPGLTGLRDWTYSVSPSDIR